MNIDDTFGEFLREYRETVGYGLRQFANEIGVSATVLSGIELGQRKLPKSFPYKKVAKALGIDVGSDDWYRLIDLGSSNTTPPDIEAVLKGDQRKYFLEVFRRLIQSYAMGDVWK